MGGRYSIKPQWPACLSSATPCKQMKLELNVTPQKAPTTAIDRRISELEEKVFFREGQPVPLPVYTRLKQLEDRVLELEGLSPEPGISICHFPASLETTKN